jgi:hypothetical protein
MTEMAPPYLYKYLVPERVDVLLQKRIRFTQPCFLNDPFEFRPGMPVQDLEDLGHFEAKVARKRESDYHEKSRLYSVLSLTAKWDSIPMWTHYAAAHRGFVIAFDTESSLFHEAIKAGKLRCVQYRGERVSLTRGLRDQPWAHPDTIFCMKSKDWTYEEEWRWIESCDPNEYADLVSGPNGELLFLRPILPESVRQIFLGYRADPSLSETIQALRLTRDYGHLEIFQVVLSSSYYKLEAASL